MRSKLLGSVSGGFSFAHLLGGSQASKGKDKDLREDDQSEEGAEGDEDDEEAENSENTEGEGRKGKKGKKAKKGEADEEGAEASAGEDDGDEADQDDEDEEDDEDEDEEGEADGKKPGGKKAAKPAARPVASAKKSAGDFKRGRKAERARVGRILSNKAAANNIELACKLATNTGMSSAAVIALLEQTPSARGGRLDGRMSATKIPDVNSGGSKPSGAASIQASWDVATADFSK